MTENTRTQRTYGQLLKALTDLLAEKPFDDIRITDLCERAGVHRSTFYSHFEDKQHLLTFGIQELMDVFVRPVDAPPSKEEYQAALLRVFKYFYRNRQEYTLLFLDSRNAPSKALFHAEYIRAFKARLKSRFPHLPAADLDLYACQFVGGLLSVIDRWLERGTEEAPEEIAQRFSRVVPYYEDLFAAQYPIV